MNHVVDLLAFSCNIRQHHLDNIIQPVVLQTILPDVNCCLLEGSFPRNMEKSAVVI